MENKQKVAIVVNYRQAAHLNVASIVADVPIFNWGSPGIGKSAMIKTIAQMYACDYNELRAAQLDPVDVKGVCKEVSGRTKFFPPDFLPNVGCQRTIMFLDELNTAPKAVQNAFLQLILDRQLGDYVLPKNVRLIAAGNRASDNCWIQPLSDAMKNRFMHIELSPTLEEWSTWAYRADSSYMNLPPASVLETQIKPGINEKIIGFLHWRPALLNQEGKNNAFATPRSWEMLSRLMQVPVGDLYLKAAAVIGEGCAHEFNDFVEIYSGLNMEHILAGKMDGIEKSKSSVVYAVITAYAHALNEGKKGHVAEFVSWIKSNQNNGEELLMVFLKCLSKDSLMGLVKSVPNMLKQVEEILIDPQGEKEKKGK